MKIKKVFFIYMFLKNEIVIRRGHKSNFIGLKCYFLLDHVMKYTFNLLNLKNRNILIGSSLNLWSEKL